MYNAIDWKLVRAKVRDEAWARAILVQLRAEFDYWSTALSLNGPDKESAWTHYYYCDVDGAKLTFDVNGPESHVCSKCGKVYTGYPWEGAWYTQMHGAATAQLERAAVLMHFDELEGEVLAASARDQFQRIVSFYAKHYPEYAVHGKHAGRGRLQPQSLDEAVWGIAFFHGLRTAGITRESEWFQSNPELLTQLDQMAQLMLELLEPQMEPKQIHNIYCWILGAIAACAAWLNDHGIIERCRDGAFGVNHQILEGFHRDGLWFEINPSYHYYTVDGLLSYLEATGPAGISNDAAVSLAGAINNPPKLAYKDGLLPAYADGWPERYVNQFATLAEAACSLLPDATIELEVYYQNEAAAPLKMVEGAVYLPEISESIAHRGSMRALLFGPKRLPDQLNEITEPASSFIWEDAGLALLRNDSIRLAMRFGPFSGHHDHHDRLCIDVEAANGWQSLDLGTSGYGSAFTEWMRSPLAHNLIVINGAMQPKHDGRLIAFSQSEVEAASEYEGNFMSRKLRLNDNGWSDTYSTHLSEERSCLWVFHGDGIFEPEACNYAPGSLDDLALSHWLKNIRKIDTSEISAQGLVGEWVQDETVRMKLKVSVPPGFDVYFAQAPGNPNGREMGIVLLRGQTKRAMFVANFSFEE